MSYKFKRKDFGLLPVLQLRAVPSILCIEYITLNYTRAFQTLRVKHAAYLLNITHLVKSLADYERPTVIEKGGINYFPYRSVVSVTY